MAFVSYAQNFEDALLNRVFGGQQTGFYVDVGAYHPVNGSVTKAFYDRGWSGINVEPGSIFETLVAARPRDINLRMAVLDQKGEVPFLENVIDRGMSHVLDAGDTEATNSVPCDTLEAIVGAHARGRPVDFIKLDAEGAELAIIRSTDWRRLRPRVLVVEATLPWSNVLANEEWEAILLAGGYVRVYFDGINCFYLPEEEVPALGRYFSVPVNVLDGVSVYHPDAESAQITTEALRHETEALRHEADIFRKERDASIAEQFRQQQIIADLIRDRDNLEIKNRNALIELDLVRAACQTLETRVAQLTPPEPPPASAPDIATMAPPLHRRIAKRAVKMAYSLVRPIVRPIAWRVRSFGIGPLLDELQRMRDELRHARESQLATAAELNINFVRFLQRLDAEPANGRAPESASELEMRRLAEEMERMLVTLAMGAAAQPASVDTQVAPASSSASHVWLRLPGGRMTDVEYTDGDLSVGASLVASNGNWEPHVRDYFASTVQPDWVCMDIGANLGAHTLALATLAHRGRVVAFEADPANYALLNHNAKKLVAPKGHIEPIDAALWDSVGTLVIGGADELAGCSFVAEGSANAAVTEQRLREVVDPLAIPKAELHMRLSEIQAMPLDHWVAANPLPRLDLIKLDVEGAEVRVIRGADRTIKDYCPILLVEYNPACAKSYFDQPADALFHELESRFATIHALENDGSLTQLSGWTALEQRLKSGKGWEDLVCLPEFRKAASSSVP